MLYRIAADLLILLHAAFILFACLGGLLVVRRPRWAWLHLPAAAWGALVEFTGWICPLTPWEARLRVLAGQHSYSGDFIDHYLVGLIYPAGLTRDMQLVFGGLVVAVNLGFYTYAWWRRR